MAQKYLLDTNICIFLLKDAYGIREKISQIGIENFAVSEITIAELFYGACKSARKEDRLKDVERIMNRFAVLPIFPCLPQYGDIKFTLESGGVRLDDFDLLIGATAVANTLIMVTDNVKHLGRIPDIVLENWIER